MTWSQEIRIGQHTLGIGHPTLIIAEIGSNHNQDIDRAVELIDVAADAGADAVKFQSLKLDKVHHIDHVTEDFKEFFGHIELKESWHARLAEHAERRGVAFMSSPTYYQAIQLLAGIPVPAIKIASAQFGFHPWLVAQAAKTGIPLVASTGLSTTAEVATQMTTIAETGNQDLVLLHCVSRYPTAIEDVNLRMMTRYRDMFGCLVGFSDHTLSLTLPAIAAARGACVIEKHITLDRRLPGPDHHFALEPAEFETMIKNLREAEMSLGVAEKPTFSTEETEFRTNFVYKCVAGKPYAAGSRLDDMTREARRADGGIDVRLAPMLGEQFVAARDLPEGTLVTWGDVQHAER